MADFKLFWPILLRQEGYYANQAHDSGGETWEGIARNKYPAWSGWAIVDSYRQDPHFPSVLKLDLPLQAKVLSFYKLSQWDAIGADQIQNQSIANFLADWGVNAGLSVPIKHVQKILALDVDGKVGPQTLAAINFTSGPDLFKKLQGEREQFYIDVVTAHPEDKEFLSDWLSRNTSFKFSE